MEIIKDRKERKNDKVNNNNKINNTGIKEIIIK